VKPRGLARRTIPFLVAATGGFLLAYVIVALFIFPTRLISSDAHVPNVTGIQYADAAAKLKAAGFKAAKGEQRYQTGTPDGAVLAQTPRPGSVEPKGTTVVLDLSRGERMVEVPRIVGLTRQQAEMALESAGFDVGEVTETKNDAPRGQVLSSHPDGGARAPVPSPVSFTVSAGPATVNIPDITGQDYDAARALLAQLGFGLGHVTLDSSSTLPRNMVIEQSPAANTSAPAGTTINLVISGHP
jgi:serine/threonine-protein kinase